MTQSKLAYCHCGFIYRPGTDSDQQSLFCIPMWKDTFQLHFLIVYLMNLLCPEWPFFRLQTSFLSMCKCQYHDSTLGSVKMFQSAAVFWLTGCGLWRKNEADKSSATTTQQTHNNISMTICSKIYYYYLLIFSKYRKTDLVFRIWKLLCSKMS